MREFGFVRINDLGTDKIVMTIPRDGGVMALEHGASIIEAFPLKPEAVVEDLGSFADVIRRHAALYIGYTKTGLSLTPFGIVIAIHEMLTMKAGAEALEDEKVYWATNAVASAEGFAKEGVADLLALMT